MRELCGDGTPRSLQGRAIALPHGLRPLVSLLQPSNTGWTLSQSLSTIPPNDLGRLLARYQRGRSRSCFEPVRLATMRVPLFMTTSTRFAS